MKDINEKLLEKIESKDRLCNGCFYYRSIPKCGEKCCNRPTDAAQIEPCFDKKPSGKYYIFVEKN